MSQNHRTTMLFRTLVVSAVLVASSLANDLDGLRDYRYCEVLAMASTDFVKGQGLVARMEVYNTVELNLCPQEDWEALLSQTSAIKEQFSTPLVLMNGPRYWTIDGVRNSTMVDDTIVPVGGSSNPHAIPMRQPAFLTVPLKDALSPTESAYVVREVERSTVFLCLSGLPVYVLTDPSGREFVMQAYSIEVVKDLTSKTLPSLETTLELPDGWSFKEVVLTKDLEVPSNGLALVIRDELKNAYQMSTNPIV